MNVRFALPVAALAIVVMAACDSRPAGEVTAASVRAPAADGAALFRMHCVVCHMADGSGVPNLQPPLTGSAYATGDPLPLLQLLLGGSEWLAERAGPWANAMPPYPFFNDEELAAVATYTRATFGDASAPPVTAAEAAAARRAMAR
jgi:mono/diheme cytochrome c family protein